MIPRLFSFLFFFLLSGNHRTCILHPISFLANGFEISASSLSRVGRSCSYPGNNDFLNRNVRCLLHREYDATPQRRLSADRPTQTEFDAEPLPVIPPKPKIVVLGASGRIGRLVIRQLLNMNLDATIVACVRSYEKSFHVMFDGDVLVESPNKNRPELQTVRFDLVPEEFSGYDEEREKDEDEALWKEKAKSVAKFYGTKISDYDNRGLMQGNNTIDDDEVLKDAIHGCTAIISCVGSVRLSSLWTDYIVRPVWRIMRKDVSSWCRNGRHPYFVLYAATRKVLDYAEREQLRREGYLQATAEENTNNNKDNYYTRRQQRPKNEPISRIRYIRISDLCVSQRPWSLVPLITNIFFSMVFRYQEMSEFLLQSSNLIDTIVLRPGDLVDEERDIDTTSLQVDSSGFVPYPAKVGRSDVAALAISAALFKSEKVDDQNDRTQKPTDNIGSSSSSSSSSNNMDPPPPFHYTFAVRWAGSMWPYPNQGFMQDGSKNANLCIQRILKNIKREAKTKKKIRRQTEQEQNSNSVVAKISKSETKDIRLKPYGICVAISVYSVLLLVAYRILHPAILYGKQKAWIAIPSKRIATLVVAYIRGLFAIIMKSFVLFRTELKKWIISDTPQLFSPVKSLSPPKISPKIKKYISF